MRKKIHFLSIIIFTVCISSFSCAQEITKEKIMQVKRMNLIYYHVGRFCPFPNTGKESAYGFTVKCSGCVLTRRIKRNNRKVARKLNKVYGKNWFEENKNKLY